MLYMKSSYGADRAGGTMSTLVPGPSLLGLFSWEQSISQVLALHHVMLEEMGEIVLILVNTLEDTEGLFGDGERDKNIGRKLFSDSYDS
jgi:hypothetical protein